MKIIGSLFAFVKIIVNCTVLIFITITGIYSQSYSLGYNLHKGDRFNTRITSEVSIRQTVMGIEQNIGMNMETDYSHEVIELPDNTSYDLLTTYKRLYLKISSSFFTIEVDTDKYDEEDLIITIMKRALNVPFHIHISKKGGINEIIGVDSLLNSLFDGMNLDEGQQEEIKQLLWNNLGEENIRQSFLHYFSFYPTNPVALNESWNIQYETVWDEMALLFSGKGKLVEVSPRTFLIRLEGKLDTRQDQEEFGGDRLVLLYGTQMTEILIDRKSGWPLTSSANQDIDGVFMVTPTEGLNEGMEIPMQMKLRMKVTNRK